MNNNVEKFLSEAFGEVRVIKEGNEIWFCASDVANILNYSSTRKLTDKIDDEDIFEISKSQLSNFGTWESTQTGGQDVKFINESGLYQGVLTITKKDMIRYEKAKQFKKWITKEVVPTIRKTGGFVEDAREEEFINNYFPSFSEEVKLAMVQDLRKQNEILKPKAEGFDKFLDSDKTYSFTEVSKLISTKATEEGVDIKISNQKLTELLREKSILTKDRTKKGFKNNPRKDYEDYFNVIVAHDREGNSLNKTQTRVKANGVDFIYKIVKEHILAN